MPEPDQQFHRTSLYEQVANRLLEKIRKENRPGDRLPSEADLSKQLGVSAITLREALSVLAFRGFIERRHGSGTYVLDPAASQWVAIITNLDLSHPNLSFFHRRMAYRLRAILRESGQKVRIYSGVASGTPSETQVSDLPEELQSDLDKGLLRALVYLPRSGLDLISAANVPLVGTNPDLAYSVSLPREDFFSSGLEALAKKGRKKVALLCWENTAPTAEEWTKLLRVHGMESRPEWMQTRLKYSSSGAAWHGFRSLWNALDEKPDGVIIDDDILFREVSLAILKERIEVPKDLLVFTHYNKGSSIILPFPCITLEVDPDLFAKELADMVHLVLTASPPKSKNIRLPIEIVEKNGE